MIFLIFLFKAGRLSFLVECWIPGYIPLDSPWDIPSLTSSMRMESTSVVIHDMSIKVAFGYQDSKNSKVSLTTMG